MNHSIKNATTKHDFALAGFVIQFLFMMVLCLQALALVISATSTPTRAQGLFNKSQQRDDNARPRVTFHKTGIQRDCNYATYKVNFSFPFDPLNLDRLGLRDLLTAVRFNLRDQLPAGLSVHGASISGDVMGGGGGAPAVVIGSIGSPQDTVSVSDFKFDPAAIESGSLSFQLTIVAKIDRSAFPVPRSVDNQARLLISGSLEPILSHDPGKPEDGLLETGEPTGIVIDVTDCDRTPPGGGGTPESEPCFRIIEGEIECSRDGDGTFIYNMPFGPDMAGRSVELVPSTPGITVDPGAQIVPAGGGVLTWTITGAARGDRLTFTVVGTEISAGPDEGWGLCCAQVVEIIIPEDIDCPDPRDKRDLEVKKFALVEQCTLGGGCRFRITVTNRGDGPYTGPIALDEVVTQGRSILEGPPNAPWTCVPNQTPMTCTHPSTTLNPGESVTLDISLRHLTRALWRLMTNCAELDYTAMGSPAPFGDLTNDKACASIPIRQPRQPEDPQKADLQLQKRADSVQCTADGVCDFTILVRNAGPSTFTGKLVINDTYPTGAPLNSTFAPSPPWLCADTGAGSFRCETAGNVTLPIGAVMAVSVRATLVPGTYNSRQIENCAVLERVPNETNLDNNRACATQRVPGADQGAPKLSITKECKLARRETQADCTITVTNGGTAAAAGRIRVDDVATLVANGAPASIQTVTPDGPDWECTPVPAPTLYCEIPGGLLTPGTSRSFDVSVFISRRPARMENCATGSLIPIDNSPTQAFGKACAAAGEDQPEPKLCSDTFVLNDAGRCVCPEGTRFRNGQCVPTSGGITPIPIPTPRQCTLLPGQVRTQAGDCVCRRGTRLNNSGTRCIRPRPEPQACQLLPGQVRTQSGDCVCRRGTRLNDSGTRCIRPRPEPQLCQLLPGQVRTQAGRCVCRRGTQLNNNGTRCVRPRPEPQLCQLLPGQVRTQAGRCVCRSGTRLNRNRTRCIRPRPETQACRLLPGQIRTQNGRCVCPRGTRFDRRRNRCTRVEARRPCPRGTVGQFQPNCRRVERVRCPKGTVGRFQPNCRRARNPDRGQGQTRPQNQGQTRPRVRCNRPFVAVRGRCVLNER